MDRIQIALPLCYMSACAVGGLLPSTQLRTLTAAAGAMTLSLRSACAVTLLPFGLAALAVWALGPAGAFGAVILRGLLLGSALGCAGTVLGAMVHFSGLLSGAVMLYYLLRRLDRRETAGDLILCACLCLAIGAVDAFWVAPFLRAALNS